MREFVYIINILFHNLILENPRYYYYYLLPYLLYYKYLLNHIMFKYYIIIGIIISQ